MNLTSDSTVQTAPVRFTAGAVNELLVLMREQNIPSGHGLRVGVKGGGCAGLSYILGFDTQREGDGEFVQDGIRILVNKAQSLYLVGMEIDYVDDLQNRGFLFNNPNAAETCGCGTSFKS